MAAGSNKYLILNDFHFFMLSWHYPCL